MKFEVYCKWEYLQKLCDEVQVPLNFDGNNLLETSSYDLYVLLLKHSEVIIDRDFSDDELKELFQENPLMKKIIKNDKINSSPEIFMDIADDEEGFFQNLSQPEAFFLLDLSQKECKRIEEDYGYLCFSSEKIEDVSRLFNFYSHPVFKGGNSTWSFLQQLTLPCNCAVLVDNHFLKDKDKLNENLYEILKTILPQKLNKNSFHLTIISEDLPDIKFRYEKLTEYLHEMFTYSIELYLIKEKVHDRTILTNYQIIKSGYGFNLFKDSKVVLETSVSVATSTFLTRNHQISNSTFLDRKKLLTPLSVLFIDTKDLFDLKNGKMLEQKVEGSKINRLLS